MRVEVLSLREAGTWRQRLEEVGEADAYFLPGYHAAHARNGEGEPFAFVAEDSGKRFFHCGMRRVFDRVGQRTLGQAYSDLETVYGYTGALANSSDPEFLRRCWQEFSAWCRGQQVVCEFVRWHPLLANHRLAPAEMKTRPDRQTVVIRLPKGKETLWQEHPPKHRGHVRKALRAGLTCRPVPLGQALPEFRRVYEAAMTRLGAEAYYLFSPAYFEALAVELGDLAFCLQVEFAGQVIASSILLACGPRLNYHLTGSLAEHRELCPINLLLHTAAEWGIAHGQQTLHLGGGRTADPADTLLQFKAGLSPHRLDYCIGQRVHDPAVYAALCDDWLQQSHLPSRPPYFTLYRLPLPAAAADPSPAEPAA